MFNFDTQIKYNSNSKQQDTSINNKANNTSMEKYSKDKSINPVKIHMSKPPKINNIISINFPLIKKLPQQTEIFPHFKSLKILNRDLTPMKSKISRKEIIQKILYKNKKYSFFRINNFNYFNETNATNDNHYNNISKLSKQEKNKSNIDVSNENINEIYCVTIRNKRLLKKNNLKNNHYNSYNYDTHNMSDYNIKETKNNLYRDKKSFSVERDNNIIINKNFLDDEKNYLNSDFLAQFTKRRRPYCKDVSFNIIKERLFQRNLKNAKNNNNSKYSVKFNSELPFMKVGSKYNESIKTLKDEEKEKFEEELKKFYENEKLKNFRNKRKLIDLSTKSKDEIMQIFKDKKLRKCNYLIGKTKSNINEIRDKINRDYNDLIYSFHEYDDWDSPENKDNLYDK